MERAESTADANGKIALVMGVLGEPQLGMEFRSRPGRLKDRPYGENVNRDPALKRSSPE